MNDLSGELLSNIKRGLLDGNPLIVYDFDGREEEADMVFYAGAVSWESINLLRKDAGGLICYVYTNMKLLVFNHLPTQNH